MKYYLNIFLLLFIATCQERFYLTKLTYEIYQGGVKIDTFVRSTVYTSMRKDLTAKDICAIHRSYTDDSSYYKLIKCEVVGKNEEN